MKTRSRPLAAPLALVAVALVSGCAQGDERTQDEAFSASRQALYGPLFAPGTEVVEPGDCGLDDCGELEPWLSQDFLTCQAGPGGVYTQDVIACYGGERRRQLAALEAAERRLYANLPAAEAERWRAAQGEWAAAEPVVMKACTHAFEGSFIVMISAICGLDYAVRRRIDLETRLGAAPAPPPEK